MKTPNSKYKSNLWKDKLRANQKEKKNISRKLVRTQVSRDYYKQELKKVLLELKRLEEQVSKLPVSMVKPSRHSYSLYIIHLSVYFQVIIGLSYRQVQSVIYELCLLYQLESSVPDISTIRYWVHKVSYYRLSLNSDIEPVNQVLIIDESCSIGQEKLLLILSVNLESIQQKGSITFSDTNVLVLKTNKSWNAALIKEELLKIKGSISYIVSDRDSKLMKAIKQVNQVHVPDCTHWVGNYLENQYKRNVDFIDLEQSLGKIRQQWVHTSKIVAAPPKLRSKARFLNLFETIDWMKTILTIWTKLEQDIQESLAFLRKHQDLIEELNYLNNLQKELAKLWKTQKINAQTEVLTENIIQQYITESSQNKQVIKFGKAVLIYVKDIRKSLPDQNTILCCSDIIESYFGKFKYRSKQKLSKGIGDDMLVMTLFKQQLREKEVLQAMEKVRIKDVELWSQENMVPSFAQEKRSFFQKMGAFF